MAQTKRKPGRPKGSTNQKTKYKKQHNEKLDKSTVGNRVKDEIWSIILFGIGIFLIISLQTKAAGEFGDIIANILEGSFGMVAFILPYYLILYGILLFAKRTTHVNTRSLVFIITIFFMLTLINSGRYINLNEIAVNLNGIKETFSAGVLLKNGGLFGMYIGALLVKIFGEIGLYIISIVTIIVSVMLVVNTPLSQFFDTLKEKRRVKREARIILNEQVDAEIDEELKNNVRAGFKPNTSKSLAKTETTSFLKKPPILSETSGSMT